MPRGAAIVRYEGPQGVVWRIKFQDADGRQVMETLGREPAWDRRKAERALGARRQRRAAAGVPALFVQAKAGHAQGSTTERYLHAHRTAFPDAPELAEARLFG
jgi:hypothetical protein